MNVYIFIKILTFNVLKEKKIRGDHFLSRKIVVALGVMFEFQEGNCFNYKIIVIELETRRSLFQFSSQGSRKVCFSSTFTIIIVNKHKIRVNSSLV